MTSVEAKRQPTHLQHIVLRGCVQGSGIRPTVARCALARDIRGFVRNEMSGVVIRIGGDPDSCADFRRDLAGQLPPEVNIVEEVDSRDPIVKDAFSRSLPYPFRIEASLEDGPIKTKVPCDRIICTDCSAEMRAETNRRFRYPFTSCTACGPRYSIIHSMPYDRQRTSMAAYAMCDACLAEYNDPDDRRYHSQTNCCPECGPQLWSSDGRGRFERTPGKAITTAIEVLNRGQILALKGVGGYQLLCDAASREAVARLRAAKARPTKPFAVMVADLQQASTLLHLTAAEQQALTSPAGPILIARRPFKPTEGQILAPLIHPGLSEMGMMLPTSPLHLLLADGFGKPLVVTSANRRADPIEFEPPQAEQRLADVANLFLHHDRPIVRPVDDSVVRCIADRSVTIRAARGLVPLSLETQSKRPCVTTGGHQKVAMAIGNDDQSVLGPYIGDMDSEACRERFIDQSQSLAKLYNCEPAVVGHDRHPDYFTSHYRQDLKRVSVQHHHAHVAAAMLEHGLCDQTVLGFSFDGTGVGTDGTIWGGEVLLTSRHGFERIGAVLPFPLAGGEAAVRQPTRVAIALIAAALGSEAARQWKPDVPGSFDDHQISIESILQLCERPAFSPVCTSVGRLFDGVAALALDHFSCSYEGEPAMLLEAACDTDDPLHYNFDVANESFCQLDWRPAIRQLMCDRSRAVSAGAMAMRWHRGLARGIATVADRYPELPVVLGGGVFQNRQLVQQVIDEMSPTRRLCFSTKIPPNDNGLAAGQLVIAQAAIENNDFFETGEL